MKLTLLLKSIFLLMVLGVSSLPAQDSINPFKTLSVGLRAMHLYDLPSYKFDNEMSRDLKGLNGQYTKVDLGAEVYVEKQFTPLLGVQAGFRVASLTGANEIEHYKSNFKEGFADLVFVLSNLDRSRVDARFNYYGKVGLGAGVYKSQRFLNADNSSNGALKDNYWEGRVGAGVQYELNQSIRLELDATYNVAYDDGFDGYDNASGSDPYLSTGVGLVYSFGNKKKKPMYAVNFFDEDYSGKMASQELPGYDADERVKMEAYIQKMEAYQSRMDSLLSWQSDFFEQLSASIDAQSDIIEEQATALADQTEVINDLQQAMSQQEQRLAQLEKMANLWETPDYQTTSKMIQTGAISRTAGVQSQPAESTASTNAEGSENSTDVAKANNNETGSVASNEPESENRPADDDMTASLHSTGVVSEESQSLQMTAYFGFDSEALAEDFKQELRNKLAGRQGSKVTLTGYADAIGADSYNDKLKARRARAVRDFLVSELEFIAEDIEIKMAEDQPDLGEENFLNRKVVVEISSSPVIKEETGSESCRFFLLPTYVIHSHVCFYRAWR
ncbi:MAG: OmpA family protein [Owenweeksia sp.]|nr:OmpA family protein [Owenweeksia sp.]